MLRRQFLSASILTAGAAIPSSSWSATVALQKNSNVLELGAKPDGQTLNTSIIQRAIDETNAAGGGLVYVPPGTYLVGGLQLKSRVTLYLEAGAVLLGSKSIQDYKHFPGPPQVGDANGHHLIFARGAEDITVCGPGTIDGQGQAYWKNIHRSPVKPEDLWSDVATFDYLPIDNLRPSPMLEFAECKNVRVLDVTLKNASGWTLRPVACETVILDGIRIRNPHIGPNTDGLDITASRNVFISNCDIATGDDAICIKSENPYGELLPTKNITITNCVLTTSCNGLKLGTASHGAFENIVFSNSVIYSEARSPLNAHVIGGINLEMVDGGSIDGVTISNIRLQNSRTPIFIRLGRRTPKENTFVRNVILQGIDACGAVVTSSITGVPGLRPSDILISDCRIRTLEQGEDAWTDKKVPEQETNYPESRMFGRLPAYGLYLRHTDRIRLRNLEVIADAPDGRPAIVADDVEDLVVSGFEASASTNQRAAVELKNVRAAFFSGNRLAPKSKTFVTVSGRESSDISFAANCLREGQREVEYKEGASRK